MAVDLLALQKSVVAAIVIILQAKRPFRLHARVANLL